MLPLANTFIPPQAGSVDQLTPLMVRASLLTRWELQRARKGWRRARPPHEIRDAAEGRQRGGAMSDETPYPSVWRLLGIWTGIGLQSFGGGASTTLLIQQTFIEKYHWVTAQEFTRLWSICMLTPGINLIAITVLLGKQLAGWRGIVASLAGLLIPSGVITCLLAALFAQVEHSTTVQAVLRGVVPATG